MQGPVKEETLNLVNIPKDAFVQLILFLKGVAHALDPELKAPVETIVRNFQPALQNMAAPKTQGQGQGPPAGNAGAPKAPGTPNPGAGQPNSAVGPPVGPVRPTPRPPSFPDPLGGLANQLGDRLNLGTAPAVSSASSAFSALPNNNFRNMAHSPGSPSRMFGVAPGAPVVGSATTPDGGSSPSLFNLANNPSTTSAGDNAGSSTSSSIEQMRAGISNISNLFPEISGPISKEVEDEANSYFQRIYNHPPHPTMSIDDVLDLLKKFQESAVQRERDVFNCMIKNLFEEYKYFPQYPEKELHITAQLFGGIIEHGLVTMIPLGLALRFVLDAVRKTPESKMYFFGIAALDRFKTRLKDYPQYCQHVSCIPHFKDFPSHLTEWVEFGANSQIPPNRPQGPVVPPNFAATEGGKVAVTTSGGPPPRMPPSAPQAVAAPIAPVPAATPVGAAASTSTATSSTIVRPTVSTIGGRPSIANTTNIDTLLNAKQKSGPQVNPHY